jgi:hypothetical protein
MRIPIKKGEQSPFVFGVWKDRDQFLYVVLSQNENADTPNEIDTAAGASGLLRPITGTIIDAFNSTTFAMTASGPGYAIMPRPLKARPPSCSQTADAVLGRPD